MASPSSLNPELVADLMAVLVRHDFDALEIDDLLRRLGPIIGVRQVSKGLGRKLTQKERQAAHVRLQNGETVEGVVRYLTARVTN
jgi:hypothetical protein